MTTPTQLVTSAKTLLFVPGNRPERFAKAAAAGAHLVVLDLEDAVPLPEKEAARAAVGGWLTAGHVAAVRINAADTSEFEADVAMVAEHDCVVMVPKAEEPDVLVRLDSRLSEGSGMVALVVETAQGVLNAAALAAAACVDRLAFGSFDLAAQLGVDPADRLAMASARSALVLASAAAGIAAPIDGVSGAIGDEMALRSDTDHALRLGFTGKLCIYPSQVAFVDEALSPTAEQIAWAQKVVGAAGSSGGVVVVDGRMVDKPVIIRARRLLAASGHDQPQHQTTSIKDGAAPAPGRSEKRDRHA